jgi:predicted acyl esterase
MRSIYTAIVSLSTALFWLAITLMASAHVSAEDRSLRESVPHDDFVIREEMVPMRDGVKLYTLIIRPKESESELPIIVPEVWRLTR